MTRRRFFWMAVWAVAAAPWACANSTSQDAEVAARLRAAQAWMENRLDYEVVPGASAAIVHDQDIVWSKGFGFANLAAQVAATPQTKYSVCSVSKLFTSVAVMQLRDSGKLRLDEPIGKYLPWFSIRDGSPDAEPVTLRGILSHVSGLPRESDFPYWTEVDFPQRGAIRDKLDQQSMLYEPFTHFQYSNLGMTLAGEVVEAVSGQPYDRYVQEKILDPLGLKDTRTELPEQEYGQSFALGYKLRTRQGERGAFDFYAVNGVAPAAGYASTVEDLARFAAWQFRLLKNGGREVLKASTLREMHRVHWQDPDWDGPAWGLGFTLQRHDDKTFVGHGGYCPGYRTALLMRPQDKIAVVVIVNVNDVNPNDFALGLYDLTSKAIGEAAKKSESEGAESAAEEDLSLYQGVYGRPEQPSRVYVTDSGDELIVLDLFSDRPARSLFRLRHQDGHTFRRVDGNGDLAEEIRFELDDSGRPVKLWRHSNYLDRMEGAGN